MATKEITDDLNNLLKGEISACETYKQALEKVEDANVRQMLDKNHQCHSKRVEVLKKAVSANGGAPAEGSGAWGAFAKLMEGGSKVFGDKASISTLEEGEDKGLADYKMACEKHGGSVSELKELLSKQEGSHARCRDLKHSLK